MKKEFVNYNQALALKELGFDEPCFGHFGSITEPEELQIFPNTESCLEPEDMTNSNLDYGLSCTAPTFSQAFRWFREKHDLWFDKTVNFNFEDDLIRGYHYNIHQAKDFKVDSNKSVEFFYFGISEEKAEFACIEKLIEIVEKK